MTDTVVITLDRFSSQANKIAAFLDACQLKYDDKAFEIAFGSYRKIVAVMSAGIVVRRIAPLLSDKWTDPAVVVVSSDMKFAIPLTGGHHGANDLAKKLEGLGMVAAVSTATEAMGKESVEHVAERTGTDVLNRRSTRSVNAAVLDSDVPLYVIGSPSMVVAGPGTSVMLKKGEYIVGIGCARGVTAEEVSGSIENCLKEANIKESEVMAFATTDKKRREMGLLDAVESLGSNLVFLDDDTINAQPARSPSKAFIIGLNGVAEPCALALSKHKELIREKKIYGRVTIAIAR